MGASLRLVGKEESKTWKTMRTREKAIFVVKVCIMICTFGFVFGNIIAR
jgi:hypothetical protein